MRVAVVGIGKIGLPLAVQIAAKGHTVIGVDVNPVVVEAVRSGVVPFPGEADLADRLRVVVGSSRLSAATDTVSAVADSEVVLVVVPLGVDERAAPDFRALDSATAAVGKGLQPGTLISYETTLPVHATRLRFLSMLERSSGMVAGRDFFLCHSPERVSSGRVFHDLRSYPKLVGAVNGVSAKRAVAFYEAALDFDDRLDLPRANGVWDLGSTEAAELAKLAETTYRDVNTGLANQFARYADRVGVDLATVVRAANSQPYSHIHTPGVAVGGHCIPVYPQFYLRGDPGADIVRSARRVNEAMPAYAVDLLAGVFGDLSGAQVAVLGICYREGVKETAFSGAFPLADALRQRGARVLGHDPLLDEGELQAAGFEPYRLGAPVGAAVLHTAHAQYRDLVPEQLPGIRAFVDGRDVTRPERWAAVPRLVIGGGTPPPSLGSSGVQVHPSADVDPRARLGTGTRVWHLAQVREQATIGHSCVIGRGAYVGAGVEIGDRVKVQNYALVYEPARLEDGVFIGPGAVLTNDVHPRSVNGDGRLRRAGDWRRHGVIVREGASVGAQAVVLAGVSIGRWAMVGAGTVVTRSVPDHALVTGMPALRTGWVGRDGVRLDDAGDGHWRCPVTGEAYVEGSGGLHLR